jgi:hypothetical protein
MTNRAIAAATLATAIVQSGLIGCSSGPEEANLNPARLWLAPGRLEVDALLVPEEPDPW